MFPSLLICAIIGWFLGVHVPWWVLIVVGVGSLFGVSKSEGLGGIALLLGMAAPLIVGMLLGSLIYGDLGNMGSVINFKYLFTGE